MQISEKAPSYSPLDLVLQQRRVILATSSDRRRDERA
jgi:hypothetical protein